MRHTHIIKSPTPKGSFSFKIPLKHFFGFCEDYKKILYGMQQRLTLTRINTDSPIHGANAADVAELFIEKISWFMPHVIPSCIPVTT